MFTDFMGSCAARKAGSCESSLEFQHWMTNYKFVWDKDLGGCSVPVAELSTRDPQPTAGLSASLVTSGDTASEYKENPSPQPEYQTSTCAKLSGPSPASSLSSSASLGPEQPLFATAYFEVLKSSKGGYGAFAAKDIEIGVIIHAEKPLLKADQFDFEAVLGALTREERERFNSLHCYAGVHPYEPMAKYMTNRFRCTTRVDGIFINSSRFNHACRGFNTCSYLYNPGKDLLEIKAIKAISKGEELTISYTEHPETLFENYGFWCDCPGCPDPIEMANYDRLAKELQQANLW